MRHTIQALVENKFGVLARVASLFSARGYNIESLAVGETKDPAVSCMTIVVNAEDERILEQIKKQLHKLIDVITVIDFTRRDYIDRDLMLVKVSGKNNDAKEIEKITRAYPVRLAEKSKDYYLLEICSDRHQEDDILKELNKMGVLELVRTGRIAISK